MRIMTRKIFIPLAISVALLSVPCASFAQSTTISTGGDFQLDLIWKANTLTPYDYSGKALPSTLSGVTIYALANAPNPQNLTYTWIVDDASSNREGPDQMGKGKDTFLLITYQIPEFVHELRVTATDEATGKSASAALKINTVRPEIDFYLKNNDNYNNPAPTLWDLPPGQESALMAKIFGFNALNENDLDLKWFLDGQPQENNSSEPAILPINITARTRLGTQTNLKLLATHKKLKNDINQRAEGRVTLYIR